MRDHIVCRTCGAEEGVFLVLRSEDETTYQCRACDCAEERPLGESMLDWWLRRGFQARPKPITPSATPV